MKTVPSTYQVLYKRKPTLRRKPLLAPLNPHNDAKVNAVNDRSPEEVHPNRFTLQISGVGTSLRHTHSDFRRRSSPPTPANAVCHKLQCVMADCVTFRAVREDPRWDIPPTRDKVSVFEPDERTRQLLE